MTDFNVIIIIIILNKYYCVILAILIFCKTMHYSNRQWAESFNQLQSKSFKMIIKVQLMCLTTFLKI